jgi:hypothetical protein
VAGMIADRGVEGRHKPLDEPNRYARTGGALYLVIIVAGILGPLLTREFFVVPGDAIATATNIAASPGLWRLGIGLDLVAQLCDVPVMLILFLLLSPVNRTLALLALLFNIVQTSVLVANQLTLVAAQLLSPDQPALADVAIRAYSYGEPIGLVFFGFTCIVEGYLIRQSRYLPWVVGLGMQVAGVAYVTTTVLLLFAPDVAAIVFLIPTVVSESALALWLVVRGVDVSEFDRVSRAHPEGPLPQLMR